MWPAVVTSRTEQVHRLFQENVRRRNVGKKRNFFLRTMLGKLIFTEAGKLIRKNSRRIGRKSANFPDKTKS